MPKAQRQDRNTTPAILLINIRQLLTLRGSRGPRRGRDLSEIGLIEDAAVLCSAGKIVSVGTTKDAQRDSWIRKNHRNIREVDCTGRVVLPGFVDSHSHPVFAAPRLVDFEKRISGASYEEIAAAGGGIRASIAGVRGATRKLLSQAILGAFAEMLEQGTTTVEAKSGYGLSSDAELKSLEAIRDAAAQWPGTVVSTLLGAHVVPPEFKNNPERYVAEITNKMIPQAARRKLAQFVDVFCDRGAFSTSDAERIFEAVEDHGLGTRAHVCQLTPSAVKPLLRFNPASLDHMDCVQDADVPLLAKRDTVATLLPAANFFLGLSHYPPARKLIDSGVAVALATDYNPGTSPTTSMAFVLSVACTHMKMSPAEAVAAATINGASALRLQDRKGSIEPGKDADLVIFDVQDYREIPYWVAANRCVGVVANGELVVPAP
jgi:imidazolonepropionase